MAPAPSMSELVGTKITNPWFSDYSIFYLELGILCSINSRTGKKWNHPQGEYSVYCGLDWG